MSASDLENVRQHRCHDFYSRHRPRWPLSQDQRKLKNDQQIRDMIHGCEPELSASNELAKEVVRFSMVWRRSKDEEVMAPGHSRNVHVEAGSNCLKLGRDTLNLDTAIGRCAYALKQWVANENDLLTSAAIGILHMRMAVAIRTAVRNHQGHEYTEYGRLEDFPCGSTKLVTGAFADFILLRADFLPLLTRPYQLTCQKCLRPIRVECVDSHVTRCR